MKKDYLKNVNIKKKMITNRLYKYNLLKKKINVRLWN